jgi:ATP/maltotriose-dependent transcriptional regulator MalT
MSSRLLMRLDAAIEQFQRPDPLQADRLRAERAGLLARQGDVAESRAALALLRAQPAVERDPLLRAELTMTDALCDYYGEFSSAARDKLEQARAIAVSVAGVPAARDIEARCEAWLAHMDYIDERIEGVAHHASRVLALAAPDAHGARSRAAMVVAMAYHYAGRFDRAQPWYATARRHASVEGDDATLSALIYNQGALRGEHVRRHALYPPSAEAGAAQVGSKEPGSLDTVEQALAAGNSSTHFDAHLGGSALEVLRPILRAGVLLAQGRHAQALVLYEAHFGEAIAQGLGRFESSLRADVAWCRLQLKQPDMARQQAATAEAAIRPNCHPDDLALTHGRLALVHAGLGDEARGARHRQIGETQWALHRERRAESVVLLERALPKAAP